MNYFFSLKINVFKICFLLFFLTTTIVSQEATPRKPKDNTLVPEESKSSKTMETT